MDDKGKSDQGIEQSTHAAGIHFATRRKILGGLAGTPVFLTFSQRAGAVESFARCIDNALPGTNGDLSDYYIDGDFNIYSPGDQFCEGEPAFASTTSTCWLSFSAMAPQGSLPKDCKHRNKN